LYSGETTNIEREGGDRERPTYDIANGTYALAEARLSARRSFTGRGAHNPKPRRVGTADKGIDPGSRRTETTRIDHELKVRDA
jgi:hypothetical protein